MSKPNRKDRGSKSESQAAKKSVETRIDAPHPLGKGAKPAPAEKPIAETSAAKTSAAKKPRSVAIAESGDNVEAAAADARKLSEQLRGQAAQLSAHLRDRQKGLDHRESLLNARLSQFDGSARGARLWFTERQEELDERRSALEEQERSARSRLARLATTESVANRTLKASDDDILQREEMLKRREAELEAKAEQLEAQAAEQNEARESLQARRARTEEELQQERQKIDTRRKASLEMVRQGLDGLEKRRLAAEADAGKIKQSSRQPGRELLDREKELLDRAESLDRREQEIKQAESLLAKAHGETEGLREQLGQKRQQFDEEARAQRQLMVAEQRRAQAELDKKRRALERRTEHVDHCQAALRDVRVELGQMHRETLEIRLATEELWAQLSPAAPPAALTHSLGQIRARLAEHYRLTGSQLDERKQELQTMQGELAEQHEKLVRQKEQIEQWSARRQEEIQQQAARLVGREQELQEQQARFETASQQWDVQRLRFEQVIRQLRQQTNEPEPAVASA